MATSMLARSAYLQMCNELNSGQIVSMSNKKKNLNMILSFSKMCSDLLFSKHPTPLKQYADTTEQYGQALPSYSLDSPYEIIRMSVLL